MNNAMTLEPRIYPRSGGKGLKHAAAGTETYRHVPNHDDHQGEDPHLKATKKD